MNPVDLLIVLLALATAAIGLALRLKLPYPVALVAAGAVLGVIPGMPKVPFPSDLVLAIVLPPVLWSAALRISWRDFRQRLPSISTLSIGLVIATTLAIGVTLKWLLPETPWAVAFTLGAIVSPPDAAAPSAVFARVKAPPSINVILQGESLINDASGLVLYRLAVAAVMTGAFSLAGAAWQFVWVATAGAAIGLVGAWLAIHIARSMREPALQTLFGILVPFALYALAEAAHASGVLAVVTGGLLASRAASRHLNFEARILGRSTWEVITLGLDALIFTLIGTQMSSIVAALAPGQWPRLVMAAGALAIVTVVVRMAVVFPGSWLGQWRDGRAGAHRQRHVKAAAAAAADGDGLGLGHDHGHVVGAVDADAGADADAVANRHADADADADAGVDVYNDGDADADGVATEDRSAPPPWKLALVLGWCGMRGIVSLTAALALPTRLPDGTDFPMRNEVIFLTFALVVLTLLVPGVTLSPLMRKLGLHHDEGAAEELRLARHATGRAALDRLEALRRDGRVDDDTAAHLRHATEARLRIASAHGPDEPARDPFVQAQAQMSSARRDRLLQLGRERHISEPVLHDVEAEIDHAEAQLQQVLPPAGAPTAAASVGKPNQEADTQKK